MLDRNYKVYRLIMSRNQSSWIVESKFKYAKIAVTPDMVRFPSQVVFPKALASIDHKKGMTRTVNRDQHFIFLRIFRVQLP